MKAFDGCKEIHCCMQAEDGAHAAIVDNTKHVEPWATTKTKKILVHLSLRCLLLASWCAQHNQV